MEPVYIEESGEFTPEMFEALKGRKPINDPRMTLIQTGLHSCGQSFEIRADMERHKQNNLPWNMDDMYGVILRMPRLSFDCDQLRIRGRQETDEQNSSR